MKTVYLPCSKHGANQRHVSNNGMAFWCLRCLQDYDAFDVLEMKEKLSEMEKLVDSMKKLLTVSN